MADGRAQACRGLESSARSRSVSDIGVSVECVPVVGSLMLDGCHQGLRREFVRYIPAIGFLRYALSRDYVRGQPTDCHCPGRVRGPMTRPHETGVTGTPVVSRPADPDGMAKPLPSRDFVRRVADG